jgi:hydrogenase maturation factor
MLPAGKVPSDLLASLLASLEPWDRSVVVGPGIGEDAAVIDLGGPDLLVAKTDPVTLANDEAARYLLAVNGNDLATMGAEPRWLLVTALLPAGIARPAVESMFAKLREACADAAVTLVGGHTEVTAGLDRPLLVGCLLGTVHRDRLLRTAGARPGDAILLAGGIAVEGTAILAREHAAKLLELGVDPGAVGRAAGWLDRPGISVRPAARALNTGAVHAMHDPTEGGLATALHELADAAGAGLRIERAAIPVLDECDLVCRRLGLDPLGLLASGALLATLEPAGLEAALEALAAAGIRAAPIGTITPAAEGRLLLGDRGVPAPLPRFDRDELSRFLDASGGNA